MTVDFFAQRVGDRGSARRRPVSAEDLPTDAGAEAGPFHAGPAEAASGADEDHGQRGHLLHAAHALYLHLQVAGLCIKYIGKNGPSSCSRKVEI